MEIFCKCLQGSAASKSLRSHLGRFRVDQSIFAVSHTGTQHLSSRLLVVFTKRASPSSNWMDGNLLLMLLSHMFFFFANKFPKWAVLGWGGCSGASQSQATKSALTCAVRYIRFLHQTWELFAAQVSL